MTEAEQLTIALKELHNALLKLQSLLPNSADLEELAKYIENTVDFIEPIPKQEDLDIKQGGLYRKRNGEKQYITRTEHIDIGLDKVKKRWSDLGRFIPKTGQTCKDSNYVRNLAYTLYEDELSNGKR